MRGSMWKYGWKLAVLLIIGGTLFLWLIKTEIIEMYLSNKLGVSVSIEDIVMQSSRTSIQGFNIRNPREFKTDSALHAAETNIEYQFSKLWTDPSIIHRIEMNDVFLSIELLNLSGSQNNWTVIGKMAAEKEAAASNHEVLIELLAVNNLNVEVRGYGLSKSTIVKQIPRLEFYNIDSKKGFPSKELIQAIFGGAGLMQYIQEFLNPQNLLPKALSPLRLFSDAEVHE